MGVAVGVSVIVGVKIVGVAVKAVGVFVGKTALVSTVGVGVAVRAAMAALPTQSTTNPRR